MTTKKMSRIQNIIGAVYGELTVIEELDAHVTPNGTKQRIVKCRCSCGNEFITRWADAKAMKKCFKCRCNDRRIDITGKRFGKLVVTSMAEDYISPSGNRLSRCNCVCDCGKTCIVNMSQLVTGGTRSCGCINNSRGLLKDYPEYLAKYDFEKNHNIDINTLTTSSHKKVWWKCSVCGKSWLADISSQTDLKKNHGCPYCSGRLVIKGKTDFASQHSEMLTEWDYDKNTLNPDEVSCKSSRKVWWKCKECGYGWSATVCNRVNGSGCPRCNIENVNSFCEQAVYYYIKKIYPDAVNSDSHLGMELDIYIPSINTAVEYDGEIWHNSSRKATIDSRKNQLCIDNGVKLIRIREPKCKPIENCIVFNRVDSVSNSSLDAVIACLLQYLSPTSSIDINTQRDTPIILSQFASKKLNSSLLACYPELAEEWHPSKNNGLTPDKVFKATNKKVWWLGKCGHEWQMGIADRTKKPYYANNGKIHNPQGCPYCSSKKVLPGFNDLQSKFPEIASEWHPIKNGDLKPDSIFPRSCKKVWWLGKCGHEWQMTPNARCGQHQGCPICRKSAVRPVECLELGKIFNTMTSAQKETGISAYNISKCLKGLVETAGGYHWKYAEL